MVETEADVQLLDELLGLLTRLEQERVRMSEARFDQGGAPSLLLVAALVNSIVAFTTSRSSDPGLLPSRVLTDLADSEPYTQLFGEEQERITVTTAAAALQTWKGAAADRRRMFQDLCRALIEVLVFYGRALTALFHFPREREQWRATFDLFVDELRTAVQQIAV